MGWKVFAGLVLVWEICDMSVYLWTLCVTTTTTSMHIWIYLHVLWSTNHYIATNKLLVPSNAQCACPDDVLTFTCTVVGPGNTIWSGTAFNCPSTSNEIILRHSQFASPGTSGNCNSGTITARSLGVENDCFRSELNVTASASLNNKTVQCQHNSIASGTITVNETAITIASGKGEMWQCPIWYMDTSYFYSF